MNKVARTYGELHSLVTELCRKQKFARMADGLEGDPGTWDHPVGLATRALRKLYGDIHQRVGGLVSPNTELTEEEIRDLERFEQMINKPGI